MVLLDEATDLAPGARKLLFKNGSAIDYDTLIVATGSRTSALTG